MSPGVQGLHVEVAQVNCKYNVQELDKYSLGENYKYNMQEFKDEVLVRSKRSASSDVCKYKKGDWSQCDQLTQVAKRKYKKILVTNKNARKAKIQIQKKIKMLKYYYS